MLMLLGMAAFLALAAFGLLGSALLVVAIAMLFRPRWRVRGAIVLGAGVAGAVASVVAFLLLQVALSGGTAFGNAFALFSAAGFGAGASIALLTITVLGVFGATPRS